MITSRPSLKSGQFRFRSFGLPSLANEIDGGSLPLYGPPFTPIPAFWRGFFNYDPPDKNNP